MCRQSSGALSKSDSRLAIAASGEHCRKDAAKCVAAASCIHGRNHRRWIVVKCAAIEREASIRSKRDDGKPCAPITQVGGSFRGLGTAGDGLSLPPVDDDDIAVMAITARHPTRVGQD